jgi:hypothetical protein
MAIVTVNRPANGPMLAQSTKPGNSGRLQQGSGHLLLKPPNEFPDKPGRLSNAGAVGRHSLPGKPLETEKSIIASIGP